MTADPRLTIAPGASGDAGGCSMTERRIRPLDPAIAGVTQTYMGIPGHEAVRRIVELAFRDAHTALDLTYAAGCFWRDPLPPEISLTANNIDPEADTALHVDFRQTGLPARSFDLVVIDPPHLAELARLAAEAAELAEETPL